MSSIFKISSLAIMGASMVFGQQPPFKLCTDTNCGDCPQSVTSGGTGYPACVVYNSDDVFMAADYPAADGGGFQVSFDIAQPDPTCATIVKSPADTSVQGCGTTIGAFQNAACASLTIKETFMVQFCCGTGDCTAAGVANAKRGERYSIRSPSAMGGAFLQHANGTAIEPIQKGEMPPVDTPRHNFRRAECIYTPDGGMEEYTRPADNTQIMTDQAVQGGSGGNTIAISKSRTQEWSTSMSAGVNILEIVSASVSFEFSESITDSDTYTFSIPPGQTGQVGFTSNLRCTTGTIDQCGDGASYHGETCTPYSNTGEGLAGTYAVIASA